MTDTYQPIPEVPRPLAAFYAYDPDELRLYADALDISCGVDDFKRQVRDWIKHGHKFQTADEALEAVRAALYDYLPEIT